VQHPPPSEFGRPQQAKHSGGLGVDDQLEFARLGDRQVDWNPLAICGACSAS
jgi:hypothetical protein